MVVQVWSLVCASMGFCCASMGFCLCKYGVCLCKHMIIRVSSNYTRIVASCSVFLAQGREIYVVRTKTSGVPRHIFAISLPCALKVYRINENPWTEVSNSYDCLINMIMYADLCKNYGAISDGSASRCRATARPCNAQFDRSDSYHARTRTKATKPVGVWRCVGGVL